MWFFVVFFYLSVYCAEAPSLPDTPADFLERKCDFVKTGPRPFAGRLKGGQLQHSIMTAPSTLPPPPPLTQQTATSEEVPLAACRRATQQLFPQPVSLRAPI